MKNHQKTSELPFVVDENHIYNKITNKGFEGVQVGYTFFTFELHLNLMNDGNKVDGLTEFEERKILLEMALDNTRAVEVILHEVIHCILNHSSLDEVNFNGNTISVTNEFLTDCMAKQFMMVNYLNPGLLELLFTNESKPA